MKRSEVEEMVRNFVADNNVEAVYGKDTEGLFIVHFLVDEDEEDETLSLSEAEKLDLNSFFIETIQSADFRDEESHYDKEDSELYWAGSQIGDRMFDLCIDFNDYKLTCVVYECDPCVDESGSDNWTTNTDKSFVLYKDLDAFQLADLSHVFRDRMTKWKISGKSRTWWIMLYKVDENGDPIELRHGSPILYVEEQVIEELRAEGFSNPKSAYFKLVDDLCKEARKKGATGDG
jgi:hypothetical protein